MDQTTKPPQDEFAVQARSLLDRGLYQLARDLAETRLASIPGDVEGRTILCEALWGLGYDEEAQEIIREIEEIIRGYSEIYRLMGRICQKKGLVREAIRYYERFTELNPLSPLLPEIDENLAHLHALPQDSPPPEDNVNQKEDREELPSPAATLTKWLSNLENLQKRKR
ncbi:MAG TPA: hypothetical protein PK175_08415 [Syntrophales bacterium]|nr:hypothetical protein [Syntrophales bacterium]HOU77748.1 hypothetical protein [Syntrophales bacterium]HPC32847.1 hypothetical protein [Syntrophales bacterium]HQG34879.1 hypothetical protein [Syntrophales bacterium]HRR47308.1 hypothetical protein [Syntrophales bacterium]